MSVENDRQLRILYTRLTSLHAQVSATRPENADKPGAPGSGLGPLVKGFNILRASRIEEPTVVALLRRTIADEWAKATVVI